MAIIGVVDNNEITDIDRDIEIRLLSFLVYSDNYTKLIHKEFDPTLLQIPEVRDIALWVIDFYRQNNSTPKDNLPELVNRKKLKFRRYGELHDIVLDTIKSPSEDSVENTDYLIKITREYMLSRALDKSLQQALQLVRDRKPYDSISLVKEQIRKTEQTDPDVIKSIPFEEDTYNRIRDASNDDSDVLFNFSGALGDFIGTIERGSFICFTGPEKRGKCLPGDQKVLMATGEYLSIEEIIKIGRKDIISFNEKTQKFITTKISAFWRNGIKDVFEVGTKTGKKVRVTLNHPFLTPEGWQELSTLKVGDFIAVPKTIPIFGNRFIPKHEIKLIAYFLADGCLHDKYRTLSYTKKDPVIKKDFEECVILMGCRVNWQGISGHVLNSLQNKYKHNKNYVYALVKKYGISDKYSFEKTIPREIFQLPKEDLSLFLKILFSSDGWVNKGDDLQVGYATTNETFAYQVHYLLSKFGIVSKVYFKKNKHRGCWSILIRDYKNVSLFYEEIGFISDNQGKLINALSIRQPNFKSFLDKFPYQIALKFHNDVLFELEGVHEINAKGKNSGVHQKIPSFRAIFTKAPSIRDQISKKQPIMQQSFTEVRNTQTGKKYFNSQLLWDEITSITSVGKQETFDLTVPETQNFVAENILVHNTTTLVGITKQALLNRLKVTFFSIGDASETQLLKKIYSAFLKRASNRKYYDKEIKYPVPDCLKNQVNTCPSGPSKYKVFDGRVLHYEEYKDKHVVCTKKCDQCIPSHWYKPHIAKPFPDFEEACSDINRRIKTKNWKDNLHVFVFGQWEKTIADMIQMVDDDASETGHIPDVIVIDYMDDIDFESGDGLREFRHKNAKMWAKTRGWSIKRNCAIITATQANKESYNMETLTEGVESEDKRKRGYVTAMYGINQTPDEKEQQIIRYNCLAKRDAEYVSRKDVTVLQCLSIGQPFVLSYYRERAHNDTQKKRTYRKT